MTNDTLKAGSQQDLDPYQSLTDKQIFEIRHLPDIKRAYPFFVFPLYGLTKENVRSAIPKFNTVNINGGKKQVQKNFAIQPIYPEDLTKKYLWVKGRPQQKNNFVVSQTFLADNHLKVDDVVGKTVKLLIYVPYSQYISTSQSPNNNKKNIKTDGNVYVPKMINKKVTGVYSSSYPYDRSEYGNSFFMDYREMHQLVTEVIKKNPGQQKIFSNFPEQKLGYSALVAYAKDFSDISAVSSAIRSMNPNFKTFSVAQDIAALNASVAKSQSTMLGFSALILVIAMVLLCIIFYLINQRRQFEMGMLSAIGYQKRELKRLLLVNNVGYGLKLFGLAEVLVIVLSFAMSKVYQLSLFETLLYSGVTNIIISGLMTIIAGTFSLRSIKHLKPTAIIASARNV